MSVLLAGAGSGREAIELAAGLPDSQVVAADARIDNLAYAARMAERYGLENLSFVQAAAADLPALGQKFHLIDSGELLLAETDAETLALLAELLQPEGVLLASIYSAPARAALASARKAAAGIVVEPPLERLRQARRSLLDTESPSPLAAWPAFYAQAGATELLYGSAGGTFDLAQLAAAAEAAGLLQPPIRSVLPRTNGY
jgi:SAM-dependent methyltransferase